MIGKIRRIRLFGSYIDFDWPAELSEFKRFNVLYGRNYSGKTMLSRIFRCFEKKSLHPDFPSAEGRTCRNVPNDIHPEFQRGSRFVPNGIPDAMAHVAGRR